MPSSTGSGVKTAVRQTRSGGKRPAANVTDNGQEEITNAADGRSFLEKRQLNCSAQQGSR